MELRELGDRLFRLHAKLIIIAVLLGVLAGLAITLRGQPQYQANVVFVLGAQDPQSAAEATVLADTARGIATGPQLVARAISATGVTRNEAKVAAAINVQTLGSSGVLTLTVTDPNPRVAVELANVLAAGVVSTRVALVQSGLASSLQGLKQQETSANSQIQNVSAQMLTATGAELTQLQGRLASLQAEAAQIATQRNALEAQQGPKTTVLDKAVAAVAIPSRALIDALLGGVLGLVGGIAIAAAREMSRPSLVGGAAISRAIGAPLLGEMSTPPDSWTLAALPDAGSYIELAADSKQVQEVRFAALDPGGRHRAQVRMLEGPMHRLRFNWSRTANPALFAKDGPLPELAPATAAIASSAPDPDDQSLPRTGLVVAVPRVLKAADVEAVTNFFWISGWIQLGVIVYSPPRKAIMAAGRGSGPAGPAKGHSPPPGSVSSVIAADTWRDRSVAGDVEVGEW